MQFYNFADIQVGDKVTFQTGEATPVITGKVIEKLEDLVMFRVRTITYGIVDVTKEAILDVVPRMLISVEPLPRVTKPIKEELRNVMKKESPLLWWLKDLASRSLAEMEHLEKQADFLQSAKTKGQTIEEWAYNCGFESYAEDLRCHLRNLIGVLHITESDIEGVVRLALISLRSNLQDR